jgi:hypothetical protein
MLVLFIILVIGVIRREQASKGFDYFDIDWNYSKIDGKVTSSTFRVYSRVQLEKFKEFVVYCNCAL